MDEFEITDPVLKSFVQKAASNMVNHPSRARSNRGVVEARREPLLSHFHPSEVAKQVALVDSLFFTEIQPQRFLHGAAIGKGNEADKLKMVCHSLLVSKWRGLTMLAAYRLL